MTISFWWLIPAVMAGAVIGFGVCALLTMARLSDADVADLDGRRQ